MRTCSNCGVGVGTVHMPDCSHGGVVTSAQCYDDSRNDHDGSLGKTLEARGKNYGPVEVQARIRMNILLAISDGRPPQFDIDPVVMQSLSMIALKISRIVAGNPLDRDSWHDIGGYAKLAEDRCPK